MNLEIAKQIINFCEYSRNYHHNIPHIVKTNIIFLENIVNEWLNLVGYSNIVNQQGETFAKAFEKTFIGLAIIIADNNVPFDLIQIFSGIMIVYIDQMLATDKNFNELSCLFEKMNIVD